MSGLQRLLASVRAFRASACRLLAAAALLQAGAACAQPLQAARLAPDERLLLDGTLAHPAWKRAPVHEAFIEHDPNWGSAPPQRTRLRLLFDEQALWVGLEALDDDPARIDAPLTRADRVPRHHDALTLYLDPVGTGRFAQLFRVNAGGSTSDGLYLAADDEEDLAPDFDWDAATARHATGWTAVLRLPFASLRHAGDASGWRLMVMRRLTRGGFHVITSTPVPREAPSFIARLQPVGGVQLPAGAAATWQLRPGLTARRSSGGGEPAQTVWRGSLDAKWRPLPQAVLDLTLEPDFSQVELDVPQLAGNTRFALAFPEKRPFFLESADLLRSPTEALYTRSYTGPRAGLRGTWRGDQLAGSALLLRDRGGGEVLLPGVYETGSALQPASDALATRWRGDGEGALWGALLAARDYGPQRGLNAVGGPELEWRIDDAWRLRAQWLGSHTTAREVDGELLRGAAQRGQRRHLRLVRAGPASDLRLLLDDTDAGFRNDSGFVNQAGVRRWEAEAQQRWSGLGPFHHLYATLEAERVQAKDSGETVADRLQPGLRFEGPGTLAGWMDVSTRSRLRIAPGTPLLAERYVDVGLSATPGQRLTLLEGELRSGRLADALAGTVRPGGSARVAVRMRPLPRLELDLNASAAWLRADGQTVYRESAGQLLAVLHLAARHSLRAIVDRQTLRRRAEPGVDAQQSRRTTGSLTYSWRESAGTALHLGLTRQSARAGEPAARQEVFLKLQVDFDEARGWFSDPAAAPTARGGSGPAGHGGP